MIHVARAVPGVALRLAAPPNGVFMSDGHDTCLRGFVLQRTPRPSPTNSYDTTHPQSKAGSHAPRNVAATMRSASALFFAALGGAAFSLGGADAAAAGGFFGSGGAAAARPRGFLPGWGLPRHESVFDRVSLSHGRRKQQSGCTSRLESARWPPVWAFSAPFSRCRIIQTACFFFGVCPICDL